MGLTLAACEDTSDLGTMQVNPQPNVAEANGVKVTYNFPTEVNLNDFVNENIPFLDIEIKKDMPENAVIAGRMEVATDDKFNNPVELTISSVPVESSEEGVRKFQGVVDGNAWGDAFAKIYNSKAPATRPNSIRYELFIQDGTSVYNYQYTDPATGEVSDWWPASTIEVTPVDVKYAVADSYLLFYTGGPAEGVKMNHSDVHKYDDPNFSYVIDITEAMLPNFKWYVTPADNTSEKYGLSTLPGNAPTNAAGDLMLGGEEIQAPGVGPYKINVNMFLKKYSMTLAANNLFIVSTGVNQSTAANFALTTTDFNNYSGYTYVKGGWTASSGPRPTDPKYGMVNGKFGQLPSGADLAAATVPNESSALVYLVNINLGEKSYKLMPMETVGLVGTINSWGGTEDIALKFVPNVSVAKALKYNGEVTLTDNDEFKVRGNNNWESGLNMTGALDTEASKDGVYVFKLGNGNDNIKSPGAGTYSVALVFKTVKNAAGAYERDYTLTLTKK